MYHQAMGSLFRGSLIIFSLTLALPFTVRATAYTSFDNALDSVAKINDNTARLHALISLENRLDAAGPLQLIAYDKQLLATTLALKDTSRILNNYLNLGADYLDHNQYPDALANFQNGLALATIKKDHDKEVRFYQGLCNLHKNIGEVSKDKSEYTKALHYADSALAIGARYKIAKYDHALYGMMGTLYDLQQQHSLATDYMKKAIAISPPGRELLVLKLNYAICLKNSKQYEASLTIYDEAMKLADSVRIPIYQLFINDNRAILYRETGRLKESEALALQTLKQAAAMGQNEVMIDMHRHLKDLYEQTGKNTEALYHANQLLVLKDTVLNREKTAQMEEMQSRFEANIKDQQISSQTATIAGNERQQLMMGIGLGLLFITGSVVFISRQRTQKLNRQITAQQAILQEQKKSLEQANGVKDRLFSVISHDLRTPVNSLLAFTTLLDNDDLPAEKARQYMTLLRQRLGTTTNLLENLLQFASSQMAAKVPHPGPVSLSEIAAEIIHLMEPAIDAKSIRIVNEIDVHAVANADLDMVALVYRNLLSNAIKYSHPGGAVHLAATVMDGYVTCTVKDSGTGMSPQMVSAFNSKEERSPLASKMGTQNEKGTGLGLMLCYTFIHLMQGTISVESEEGQGCTFTFSLPYISSPA